MPWLFPEFYMKLATHFQNQSISVTSTQCIQYGHNHNIHHIHLSMQERAHTNQSVEPTPATAHSGTYIHTNQSVDNIQQQLTLVHTNQSVDNSSLWYTQTRAWTTAHSGTHKHKYCTYMYTTYTHIQSTLSVGTLNSSLECIHTQGWRSS